MSRVLPMLFNTEMVRAILDGRKTVTRRCVPGKIILNAEMEHTVTFFPCKPRKDKGREIRSIKYFTLDSFTEYEAPYQPGDILYVRETWNFVYDMDGSDQVIEKSGRYVYYADVAMPFSHWVDSDTGEYKENMPWRPSIHMPKEAARIWLKVTDVRVERLQEIDGKGVLKEGLNSHVHPQADYFDMNQREMFERLWNSTIKKSDLDRYGWEANPWVWVIEFERREKPGN